MLVLKDILLHKKKDLSAKKETGYGYMQEGQSLLSCIDPERINIIAEIKKASPSKGPLNPGLDIAEAASAYDRHRDLVCGISVVTEELYFGGKPAYILSAKKASGLPILRKDFLFCEQQVFESRKMGADCILLISALLGLNKLKRLHRLAIDLGLEVLVEVHHQKDLDKALAADAKLIGINNRDLSTMTVRKDHIFDILKSISPKDLMSRTWVCESGIGENGLDEEMGYLKKVFDLGIRTFLIGSYFMQSADLLGSLERLKEKTRQSGLL